MCSYSDLGKAQLHSNLIPAELARSLIVLMLNAVMFTYNEVPTFK